MKDEIDVRGAAPYNPRKGKPPLTGIAKLRFARTNHM